MEFRLLGPLEATDGAKDTCAGGTEAARAARAPAARRQPNGVDRSARRRPLGGEPARLGPEDGADLRLAASSGVARGDASHPTTRLRDRGRARTPSMCSGSSGSEPRATRRSRGREQHVPHSDFREALALWRGDPLAEFQEPFAQAEAARLKELYLGLRRGADRRGSRLRGGTASSSPSSMVLSQGILSARAFAPSRCSRSTARAARPRRSRATTRSAPTSPTSSGWSRLRACVTSSAGSCAMTLTSVSRPPRRPCRPSRRLPPSTWRAATSRSPTR